MLESLKLGFGEPVGVSAETGEGMADLYSALQPHIDLFMKSRVSTQQSASEANSEGDTKTGHINGQEKAEDKQLKVAIMGLPNVVCRRKLYTLKISQYIVFIVTPVPS